jgi:hypothetical protein
MVARDLPHTTGELTLWDRVALVGLFPLFGNCTPRVHTSIRISHDMGNSHRRLMMYEPLAQSGSGLLPLASTETPRSIGAKSSPSRFYKLSEPAFQPAISAG